ncbi:HD domain-containing protein [Desulfatitalea alkaliphila]|uniref:HDIG domain-containing protein n=1 Tax=Desulfatitalea alkaliphila TaxID=2929485 RepID=A0AA41R242_9BACT|nr:HDIG domain-containing protein [Desulfatitalea alkaliphila]
MHIPERAICLSLLDDMDMPEHILAHSQLVCQVALLLTDALQAAGVPLNRPLVHASALLHDITKPRSFTTGENHAQTGGEYLAGLGFPEVGEVVRQHVVLDAYFAAEAPNEAEIVNYADKRVLHDKIVPLDQRMQYILARYAKTETHVRMLQKVWEQTDQLEKRLFAYLRFTPLQLCDRVDAERCPP